jgi:hypothetical protein
MTDTPDILRGIVKPLAWHGLGTQHIAYTCVGDYHITGFGGEWYWSYDEDEPNLRGDRALSLEAAQAAANADHAARVLASIDADKLRAVVEACHHVSLIEQDNSTPARIKIREAARYCRAALAALREPSR